MVVNGKRMKSRVTADLFDFLTFPCRSDDDDWPVGPFRTRVRWFLSNYGLLPPPSSLFPQLLTWQLLFRVGDSLPSAVCLDVIEEDVSRSRSVYCDQCRVVGWSGHPVCGKRYHFIIKADGNSIGGYYKPCTCCGDVLLLSESRCKTCDHVTATNDVEDWVYNQLEITTHLLHGVVHSNGYGHLLRVNGREGGSAVLSGCHIMDFWDRLCKALGVRKISVMDVSKKYGLEYRLIHAITRGHTWYGEWGYEFGAGSYAVTQDAYLTAVKNLSNIPLSMFFQGWTPSTRLRDVISFYRSLSESELVNIRDLFSFIMSSIHDLHKSSSKIDDASCKKQPPCASGFKCSWTMYDIRRVEEGMFRVLRAVTGSNWVSRRTLRGAVYKVASPDLLDYCLKELGGKSAADGMVVSARCNPDSGAYEYRLEQESSSSTVRSPSEGKLLQDLRYLYENLLYPQTMWMWSSGLQEMRDHAISAAKKLLDCKQFMKDYKPSKRMSSNRNPCLSCEVELVDLGEDYVTNPPSELIGLPANATISDLKLTASQAYEDVYLMFRKFEVEEVVGYGSVDDSTPVKLLLGSRELVGVRARGRCIGKSRFRMERGIERWTVDCSCGAKDDDGERMLACDVCGVWQHTRCSGIQDLDTVPARYLCHRCCAARSSGKNNNFVGNVL